MGQAVFLQMRELLGFCKHGRRKMAGRSLLFACSLCYEKAFESLLQNSFEGAAAHIELWVKALSCPPLWLLSVTPIKLAQSAGWSRNVPLDLRGSLLADGHAVLSASFQIVNSDGMDPL